MSEVEFGSILVGTDQNLLRRLVVHHSPEIGEARDLEGKSTEIKLVDHLSRQSGHEIERLDLQEAGSFESDARGRIARGPDHGQETVLVHASVAGTERPVDE